MVGKMRAALGGLQSARGERIIPQGEIEKPPWPHACQLFR
jgi:hypothetical protein